MLYCSWDMACDGGNCCFWFWAIFALLPPNSPKNQNLKKKWKKTWRHHFTQVYQKSWLYAMLFLRYGAWRMQLFFFILGYFLPFYPNPSPPNSPKNKNFKKMMKTTGDIIILHKCTKNHDHILYATLFLRYGTWHM